MAQLEYRDADELLAALRAKVFIDLAQERWRVTALVIHRHRVSGKELQRVAYLRRVDASGGREWEIPLATLYETAEVER
ncbi:hypothetical protein ACODT4_44475 [Streptomyces sp. 2.9]|uniref:hypothetical protein n=1 Tax=Streptomyces tritrimontium TaxID=3406573 RepID=UPI003BB4A272